MLLLTFMTGVVDAVGYLGLDHVFIGNMTGNIVILAMGAAGADLPILGPFFATLSFLLGAFVSGLLLRRSEQGWNKRITAMLFIGVIALGIAGVGLVLIPDAGDFFPGIIFASLIAAYMGMQALVARHLAVRDVTTVVITSTMTALAGESFVGRDRRFLLNRRSAAIIAMFTGAGVGAVLLLYVHISVPLLLGVTLITVVAVVGARKWNDR